MESNPSSVTNLKDSLPEFRDIYEFRSEMMNFFLRNLPEMVPYKLSQSEIAEAESLAISKYRTWEWNWAYGPAYTFNNSFQINGKQYSCSLFIKDGIIWKCSNEGSDQLISVAKKLIGCRHMVEDLQEVFRKENINIPNEEIFYFF